MTVGKIIACSCPSYANFSGQCRERDQGRCQTKRAFKNSNMVGSYYGALNGCTYRHIRGQRCPVQCHSESLFHSQCMTKVTNLNGMKLGTFFWEHKANGVLVKSYRMCQFSIFRAVMGSRYAGDHCSWKLKCFLSEPTGVNPGNILKSNKLNISCKGQGSGSDISRVDGLEYESHAELASTDTLLNQIHTAVLNDHFCDSTNGVPYEKSVVTKVDDGEMLPLWQSFPKRWIIVLLCFSAFLLCNMDRVNMSIAILPMSAEFHWNSTTVGLVQSSFFWGYLLTQVAGGIWADSIGGKQVLGFGVIWWSLATVLTPFAAKAGLPILLLVRACMGIGEGVAMPAMNNLLSKWVPVKERSRSLALVYSGMHLGSVTGLAFSPTFIHKFNWPSVFISFGSLGILWFAAWQYLAYSSPFEDPTMSSEERYLLVGNRQTKEPIAQIPWRHLLSKSPVWALIVCHFCHNWGTFIILTWMPTYYCQVLKFNLMESGMFSVLPWLTMALSANMGGWIADALVSRGVSITVVRKVMQTIGFLGPAFCLTLLGHAKSPALAVFCMMCSQGCDAFSQSGLYSNHQDIGPRYAGVLLGLSNTAGVLAGVIGTAATGYILQHGTWDDVFKVAVGLYIFGTVFWNIFCTGEQIFD